MSIKKDNYLLKFVCRQCAEDSFNGRPIRNNVPFFNVQCDVCTCQSESAPVLAWNFSDVDVERIKNVLSE